MSTIKEIAKICDVSVATVSNIINNKGHIGAETRERVLKVIEEKNYTPNTVAKNLKVRSTRTIGVIAEDMTVFALPDIIDGITEYCEQNDYQFILVNLRLYKKFNDRYYQDTTYKNIVHKECQKLKAMQVEGIIYVSAHERLINVISENLGLPVVVAYGFTGRKDIPSVVVDDTAGAGEIVSYLISQGHKKIGVIAGKKESLHTQARLLGYQSALFENGILYDPEMVAYGEWDWESGYSQAEELIKKGSSAIFCMNDVMAAGVYDRANEMGYKIGSDIAVVGYDNREIASFERPPITTMGLPLHDIGYKASDVLLKLLRKEEQESKDGVYYLKCNLFVRKSVNNIPKK